ncbi:hypothetical protein [uncultured Sphingomonas sp.]|uniref:hypothetical protein n=1 Tax=uncultured Sphingomonas sp. TaxID=158754 RepID=UPI0035CA8AC8
MSALSAAGRVVETAVPGLRGAKLAVHAILAALALALVAFAGWWLIGRPRAAHVAAATARVQAATATATSGAAQDALKLRIQVDQQHVAIDRITEGNAHAIQSAPGAAMALDPALDRAGRFALCMRGAYRADPGCLALRGDGGRGGSAGADAGSGTPQR